MHTRRKMEQSYRCFLLPPNPFSPASDRCPAGSLLFGTPSLPAQCDPADITRQMIRFKGCIANELCFSVGRNEFGVAWFQVLFDPRFGDFRHNDSSATPIIQFDVTALLYRSSERLLRVRGLSRAVIRLNRSFID